MSEKEKGFINCIFVFEKCADGGSEYLDVDIDVSKFKYILSQIERDDGHIHIRMKRKESPSPTGLSHNCRVIKSKNPEFYK